MASQTIAGHELQYTQDNLHAFAYSGLIEVAGSEITLLEFHTNSEYLKGTVQFQQGEYNNDRYEYRIYFNDIQISTNILFGPGDTNGEHVGYYPLFLIIPPDIRVKMTAQNIENTNQNTQVANFTGRVYEMLPVRN